METMKIQLDKERILTTGDVKALDLDTSKTYALRFLYNTKLNQAADPKPFRINENFADNLADKVIGMPWIVPPKIDKHLKSDNYEFPDPKALLTFQTQYSIGKFVATLRNEKTDNYYGIVEIKPEYTDDFNAGRLLPSEFTSITLGNPVYDKDDSSIIDAEFLNLQTVGYPGYKPSLASIQGVCNAGLKECISELQVLGASGQKLDDASFSNIIAKVVGAMSQETSQVMSPEQLTEAVQTLMKVVGEIKEKLESGSGPDDKPPVQGAAGESKQVLDASAFKQQMDDLKGELKSLKSETKVLTAENEKLKEKERLTTATHIAEQSIKLGKIKEDAKEETIKFYLEMKNEDGSLTDLSRIAEALKDIPEFTKQEKIVGASGGISGFTIDTGKPQDSNASYAKVVSRLYKNGVN